VRSTRPLAIIAVLACCLASCGEKPEPAARTVTPSQLKITTTLDGRRDLPLRVRWLARPSAPPANVAEVEFMIDGKLRAVDHHPPYKYGNDDHNGDLGWLVTSRLRPGPHRFTARARLTDGQTASDTVIARVDHPPSPPAAFAPSRWPRNVSAATSTRRGGDIPAGRRTRVSDHTVVPELDPHRKAIVQHAIFPVIQNDLTPVYRRRPRPTNPIRTSTAPATRSPTALDESSDSPRAPGTGT
jgi:hypothetical protein